MSMIALREVHNHQRRSIITANGPLEWNSRGIHLEVKAKTTNNYYKFSVDSILGRLSCAPEPAQLLFKGLLHALTSFALPDGLTGRTGTEEAFAILSSGQCQPWQPLDSKSISVIQTLATLGPRREYYPSDKRLLQRVVWGHSLSANAQSDFFYTAIREIITKSNHLCDFSLNSSDSKIEPKDCDIHLRKRGKVQESRYQRTNDITKLLAKDKDCVYKPRDRDVTSRAVNTSHISRIVWSSQFRVNTSCELTSIMATWSLIGGFKDISQEGSITLKSLIENHMSLDWGSQLQFCKEAYHSGRFKLIFRLSLLAFSENPDMDMIKMFAAVGRTEELNKLPTPAGSSFNFTEGTRPNEGKLERALATICPKYVENPKLGRGEQAKRRKTHEDSQAHKCQMIARHLTHQWPVECPSLETLIISEIDLEAVLEAIKPKWLLIYQNFRLLEYIQHVQKALDSFRGEKNHPRPAEWSNELPVHTWEQDRAAVPSLPELLMNDGPSISPLADMCTPGSEDKGSSSTAETRALSTLINRFVENTIDPARKMYGQDLRMSLKAYEAKPHESHQQLIPGSFSQNKIGAAIHKSSDATKAMISNIELACAESDQRSHWLGLTMLWPAVTPVTILEQLRSTACTNLSHSMKEAIIAYGMSITILQKYYRMQDAVVSKQHRAFGGQRLVEEYHNIGHQNWNPMEAPEWLLIQIEADILFRPEQVDVANAIIANESTTNAVLQLNMGKGKMVSKVDVHFH